MKRSRLFAFQIVFYCVSILLLITSCKVEGLPQLTIGDVVDFSVEQIEIYGPLCRNAAGEGYRPIAKGEEVAALRDLLSGVRITSAFNQETPTGFLLALDAGADQSIVFASDKTLLINRRVYTAQDDLAPIRAQLEDSCKAEPPPEQQSTTIGKQVDFNVERIVSDGMLCKTQAGVGYTRVSTDISEIRWFADLLSGVPIVPDHSKKEVFGFSLILHIGEKDLMVIRNENSLSINGQPYRTGLPMTAELEQLKELYSELPTLEYPVVTSIP